MGDQAQYAHTPILPGKLSDGVAGTSVMEGGTEQPLGYVAFSTPLDARMAFEYFSSRFPQADVQYVGKIRDDEAFPPNDTLSIGGFKGSKYEFRRHFHDFRNEIIDVRRSESNLPTYVVTGLMRLV